MRRGGDGNHDPGDLLKSDKMAIAIEDYGAEFTVTRQWIGKKKKLRKERDAAGNVCVSGPVHASQSESYLATLQIGVCAEKRCCISTHWCARS